MYVQPSWLDVHEAKVHYDAGAIQDPKQPGNDLDVYLKPLVDELLLLWKKEGVHVRTLRMLMQKVPTRYTYHALSSLELIR
jgi:hypothetical protein